MKDSTMTPGEYLEILHVAERLKNITRHCTTSEGRPESVAEHSWRLSLMPLLLQEHFPDVDINRVIRMCLIHDLGECFTGDIPAFLKTDAHREKEHSLLRDWVKSLPEAISREFTDLYEEMDALQTGEARLYKALDKLEAVIQHNESPLETWTENEYDLNRTYGFDEVSYSEWLTSLRKEILSDTIEKIECNPGGQQDGTQ